MSVPGPLQTVQTAEFLGHDHGFAGCLSGALGRGYFNVEDHGSFSTPLPLVKDGDLIAIVQHRKLAMEPKPCAEVHVEQGTVRAEDRFGMPRLILLHLMLRTRHQLP